jgi:hypothetical protein
MVFVQRTWMRKMLLGDKYQHLLLLNVEGARGRKREREGERERERGREKEERKVCHLSGERKILREKEER